MFRGALFLFLCLVVLRMTGTSAVITTPFIRSAAIAVANLNAASITASDFDNQKETSPKDGIFNFQESQSFAFDSVVVEQFVGLSVGYRAEPSWVIPLPVDNLGKDAIGVTYDTDLVHFRHSCQWQAPSFDKLNHTTIGNVTWSSREEVPFTGQESTIYGLTPNGTATGESAFLFFGGNSTPVSTWLDLSDLPTSPAPAAPPFDRPTTLLTCNPHLEFTSGKVLFYPTPNPEEFEITVRAHGLDTQFIGHINPDTIRSLFSWIIFHIPAFPPELNTNLSKPTTLIRPLFVPQLLGDEPGPMSPNLSAIEERMDSFTLSAFKIFTRGYSEDPFSLVTGNVLAVSNTNTTSVNAEVIVDRPALSASLPFAITHSVLFVVTVLGLAGLALLNSVQDRAPFDLVHVEKVLNEH